MAVEKWVGGSLQGLTWSTGILGAEINSLSNLNSVLAFNAINNSSPLDIFFDVSVSLGAILASTGGAAYVGLYLLPLNEDGASYGNGQFSTVPVAFQIPSQYFLGAIPTQISTLSLVVTGAVTGLVLPPGTFKFGVYNGTGVSFAASTNVVSYRTYNRSVA